ncbi:glycogen synthase kinase-3 alpha isoform X2 [Drosophila ficusphila]|uniref:glycogen synthase kinase-3 alpha isoform X2 n=1 Tax=Drosophila ficusphila TaxID=30025 RepID=UPI0007E6CC87|nr:glycogen synthase kinase-3 alpha isoform X2 [Drosophila ficusphila]
MENQENHRNSFNSGFHGNNDIPLITANSVITTYTKRRHNSEPIPARIEIKHLVGSGAFGLVYKAKLDGTDEVVAVKQVQNNSRLCHKEAEIMVHLGQHSNIIRLIMQCYVTLGVPSNSYIFLELQPPEALVYVRILSYQIFRGLAYLHSFGIFHRDIKPDNLLINNQTMMLKLGDFGSADFLMPGEPNQTYICSRFYRAPELFANHNLYSCAVDIWSAGCVLAELLQGSPLFLMHKHELMYIINLLGSDGLKRAPEIYCQCPDAIYQRTTRPSWDQLLNVAVPEDLSDLLNSCLVYQSSERIPPMMACAHCSYDELRIMDALQKPMPNGQPLPPLFNFSSRELEVNPKLSVGLLPLYFAQMEEELPGVAAYQDV